MKSLLRDPVHAWSEEQLQEALHEAFLNGVEEGMRQAAAVFVFPGEIGVGQFVFDHQGRALGVVCGKIVYERPDGLMRCELKVQTMGGAGL